MDRTAALRTLDILHMVFALFYWCPDKAGKGIEISRTDKERKKTKTDFTVFIKSLKQRL